MCWCVSASFVIVLPSPAFVITFKIEGLVRVRPQVGWVSRQAQTIWVEESLDDKETGRWIRVFKQ
jgi:hypothetical protein